MLYAGNLCIFNDVIGFSPSAFLASTILPVNCHACMSRIAFHNSVMAASLALICQVWAVELDAHAAAAVKGWDTRLIVCLLICTIVFLPILSIDCLPGDSMVCAFLLSVPSWL